MLVSVSWSLALGAACLAPSGRLPFGVTLAAILLSGAAAIAVCCWALIRRGETDPLWAPHVLAAALLGALVLGSATWGAVKYPWLRDVAAADNVPSFRWLPPTEPADASPFSDEHRELLRNAYPQLRSSQYSSKPERVFAHALTSASRLPQWRLERMSQKERRIEGTARTSLGFDSQVVIVVRPEGKGSAVDVRARSLIPTGDFGENARLIVRFLDHLGKSWMCRPPAGFAAKKGA